ncbi:hypothetical protein [Amycolatopsis albispora]|uniref:Uncharacterized protein n=1 Tax=Amycolatopsis albispora TaxID=1804986 RepID=A0A344L590_9PSEU|nr:hypothetical protein [Amycolatopsis albispora]AXB43214.1 hypothetical protein A4R43_12190 [Amycolatopsis albispora]
MEWVRLLAEQHREKPLPPDELREWLQVLTEEMRSEPLPRELVRDWLWLRMVERRNRPPLSPLEGTRKFLRDRVDDAGGLEEVRADVARTAASDPRPIREAVEAIEALIAEPSPDGTLSWIVAIDGNTRLDDASDSGAIEYLHELAQMLREVLDGGTPAGEP